MSDGERWSLPYRSCSKIGTAFHQIVYSATNLHEEQKIPSILCKQVSDDVRTVGDQKTNFFIVINISDAREPSVSKVIMTSHLEMLRAIGWVAVTIKYSLSNSSESLRHDEELKNEELRNKSSQQ